MAAHGARRLGVMVQNLSVILGVEAMCAAQGIEVRAPLVTSPALQAVVACLRQTIPTLTQDRYLSPDIENAATLVRSDALAAAAHLDLAL